MRVLITGAAGLVGQNLIARLGPRPDLELVAIDKHRANIAILRALQPHVTAIEADLAEPGDWRAAAATCEALVILHAQIGGRDAAAFTRNTITATETLLEAASAARYVVHVSSSVVNSQAIDAYTESKKRQEALIAGSGLKHVVLRPTLMFGWFDRKHLGWLARFMRRTPVFPIPGDGRYLRQPLYAGDFAAILEACLEHETTGTFNISGLERIDYIDLIGLIRATVGARALLAPIPFGLFDLLLRIYGVFDRDPPFTPAQLKALATPDVFETIDWPGLFGVARTPLREALTATFTDPTYGAIELEF